MPEHCEPQNKLLLNLSSSFNTCIPTNLALLSTILGSLSICAWLFAQLPQIYKNWKLKSTAGLSIYFLLEWCLGDTANLVGAILTKQATWQVTIAAYYSFVDCVLVLQFIYFTHFLKKGERWIRAVDGAQPPGDGRSGAGTPFLKKPPAHKRHRPSTPRAVNISRDPIFDTFRFPPASPSPREKSLLATSTSRPVIRSTTSASNLAPSPKTALILTITLAVLARASPLPTSNDPPAAPPPFSTAETAGNIISWLSTLLYLGSRLPQLVKNYRRRSTAGLSPFLFAAAFCGNLFYSSSLLANPLAWGSYGAYGLHGWAPAEGSDRAEWVRLAVPFFLGAAGVLGLDAAVGVQFLIYGEGKAEDGTSKKKVVEYRDEVTGKRHWRKVSGWMRGWVPSPGLKPVKWGSFGSLRDAEGLDERRALLDGGTEDGNNRNADGNGGDDGNKGVESGYGGTEGAR